MPTKYRYPKLDSASSYKSFLERKIEDVKLRGAQVVLKTYAKRCPAKIQQLYEMNSTDLRDMDSIIVTLQSGGKIIAHALLTNDFFYDRIKVSDREGTDDMTESVNRNFLMPIEEAINGRH